MSPIKSPFSESIHSARTPTLSRRSVPAAPIPARAAAAAVHCARFCAHGCVRGVATAAWLVARLTHTCPAVGSRHPRLFVISLHQTSSTPPSTPPSTLPSPPGQVKQISGRACATLSKVMVALAERVSDTDPDELDRISALALELGVRLRPGSPKEGPAATAMWLFDGSVTELPGGFDVGELSPNSPVKVLQSFPQDLVFVGRSTVLIKGIAARLGITWSLAQQWSPIASQVLARNSGKLAKRERRVRFGAVAALFAQWAASKVEALLIGLPAPIRRLVAAAAFRLQGGTRKAA